MVILEQYINYFANLRRAPNNGGAPHKPILLLSVLDCFQDGYINSEKIYITSQLIASFESNWLKLVRSNHIMNFALPFFHLSREPFWNLKEKEGCTLELTSRKSIKSSKTLDSSIDYALIDKDLLSLFLQTEKREVLRKELLNNYFPSAH